MKIAGLQIFKISSVISNRTQHKVPK